MSLIVESYKIISILLFVIGSIAFFYGFHAIYYAYFKTKDERQKYVVIRSAAHAFSILLIYYVIEFLIIMANSSMMTYIWNLLHFGIDSTTPMGPMLIVFGICLFINKRKMGGS